MAPGGVPAAPTNLTAAAVSHTAVLLEWKDNSTNETSFRIEARTGANAFQEVGSVEANINYFAVEELSASTHYDFRVRARNGGANSVFSNVAGANTAGSTAACVRDDNTACLINGRFRVTGQMKNFQTPPVVFSRTR